MPGAVSVLVRGTVKWRLVFTKALYSDLCFLSCAGSLVTWVPLWGPLGGPLCCRPCYHSWFTGGMCQKALDMERSDGGERAECNAGKQRSWSVVRGWISCRVHASSHVLFVALEWAATAYSAKAVSTGCIRSAVGSSAWQRITGVHGAREQHAP